MKRVICSAVAIVFVLGVFTGCAVAPKHPALTASQLPDLIPLRYFFLNKESKFGYRVSPDGEKLGWIAVKNRRLTLHLQTIGQKEVKTLTNAGPGNIYGFSWTSDSRRLLYRQDQAGNENYHIYMADAENLEQKPVDLTPHNDTRASIHQILRNDPDHILVSHNRRDKRLFDLYRINLTTREQVMLAKNPGKVFGWITDDDGTLKARVRRSVNRKRVVEGFEPSDNTWKHFLTLNFEDRLNVLGFPPNTKEIWALSNRGRDRIGLVRLNLNTGEEKLVYEDPEGDVGYVVMSQITQTPLFAASFPDYQKLHFFDPEVEADVMAALKGQQPVGLRILSADRNERIATVSIYTDKGYENYLYYRDTRKRVLLSRDPMYPYRDGLADMKPISFKSRDGLTIHGYLTMPDNTSGTPLPMVLFVHGGPWSRDYWGYRSTVQFLANRGYAVLQINYRGSTGYGRAFKEAAIGEFAGKMHTDLIDGVHWAVEHGIADPDKIAIYGHSYGGYAALVGLTFTPDVFACGVDVVGISNLISFTQAVPKYWKIWMPYWYRYVGNPNKPEDRRKMKNRSPLFHADRITRPLLIVQGANDPRVKQQESDQIVAALRKSEKDVAYILFPDEGHSIRHWENRLIFYRRLEDFLARHLGGRSAGFDLYELGIPHAKRSVNK